MNCLCNLLLIATTTLLFHSPTGLALEPVLTVGLFNLAPHAFTDSADETQVKGAAIDYMERYIAPEMGVSIHWQVYPFSRLIMHMEEGKLDAVLTLAKDGNREKRYLYPDSPLTYMQSGLAVLASSPLIKVQSPEDLLDTEIGFTKHGYLSPFMRDARLDINFIVGDLNAFRTMLRLLNAKRLDAVYNPTIMTLRFEARQLQISDHLRFIPLPEQKVGLYTVFCKGCSEALARYNHAHNERRQRTPYETLLSPYLAQSPGVNAN
ncbi:MAG: transporter substrate-binding domain-containing protein [Pseudomonadales bacterium]|nr:transporter substrate-binding domain-containing protein [Pseudomonadales bacterium]